MAELCLWEKLAPYEDELGTSVGVILYNVSYFIPHIKQISWPTELSQTSLGQPNPNQSNQPKQTQAELFWPDSIRSWTNNCEVINLVRIAPFEICPTKCKPNIFKLAYLNHSIIIHLLKACSSFDYIFFWFWPLCFISVWSELNSRLQICSLFFILSSPCWLLQNWTWWRLCAAVVMLKIYNCHNQQIIVSKLGLVGTLINTFRKESMQV